MNWKKVACLVLLVLPYCTTAQAQVDLWGTIVWSTRAPATGIELRVKHQGNVVASKVYTNQSGRYGLYGLSTPTSNYTLEIIRANAVVKTVRLPALNSRQQIPDIVLP